MRYIVDFGDKCRILNEKQLEKYYKRNIDKSEYADILEWKWDMLRSGLITEIIQEVWRMFGRYEAVDYYRKMGWTDEEIWETISEMSFEDDDFEEVWDYEET